MDVAFWVAYGLFWHAIFAPEPLTGPNLLISGILTFWQAVAAYLHIRFLLEPRYSGRQPIPLYAIGALGLVVTASCLSWSTLYAYFAYGLPPHALENFLASGWEYWTGALLGGMGMAVAFTGAIHLFGRRREQQTRERELEKARAAAELAYLRGQLNPHFLFNALNSIHVLIPRSPEEAQRALEGFSELLRYQLYRSEEELVPLTEELAQLRQFADLSRLRLEEDFVIELGEPVAVRKERIPPMLLLPLLENAIKYSPQQGGEVVSQLQLHDGRLRFRIRNLVATALVPDPDASGIGLANIRRRLGLLYPDDHSLEAAETDGTFTISLDIPLTA